jgi:putative transposase
MKASKFSEAQIAFVLKQAEGGTAVGEVCRKAGISEATLYNWHKLCRFYAVQGEAASPVRVEERQTEAGRGRPVAGQGHAAGRGAKNVWSPVWQA